ncbi:MAG: hypothetical protein AAB480_02385 [Patescibacteria group bacterium]
MPNRTFAVFAPAAIAGSLAGRLLGRGDEIFYCTANDADADALEPKCGADHVLAPVEVESSNKMNDAFATMPQELDGIIFCAKESASTKLSELEFHDFEEDVFTRVLGAFNTFKSGIRSLKTGGCFVFMSGLATSTAIRAAEYALIEDMRKDDEVVRKNVRIHHIMTPTPSEAPTHVRASVAGVIVKCLEQEMNQDLVMNPSSC